ncbi:MAG: fatty acid desaturase [Planctomycetales bacterium]|nr:fatty acid desaturase [Planctomycetales bacterium]
MNQRSPTSFPLAEMRRIVHDLFQPDPRFYWTDFLITLTIAYVSAGIYFLSPLFSPQQIGGLVVAGFALHRLANYIHEVAHLHAKRSLRSFQITWDILVGIPTLMPSYFFHTHMSHHNTNHFGTSSDCEYVPLGRGPLRNIGWFLCQVFLQPLFVLFRHTLVTPISFLHPRLRQWVLGHLSSFVFVWPCPRQIPADAPRAAWAAMDVACWLRASAIFVLVALDVNPWYRIPQLYLLAIFALSLHYVRSLTAHRYLSDGHKMPFDAQLMDSIDITGHRVLTELFYPVGLRYHALHHLFPAMPYHNLGIANRRLLAELPPDSPYRQLVYPGFWSVIWQLFRDARESTQPARGQVLAEADLDGHRASPVRPPASGTPWLNYDRVEPSAELSGEWRGSDWNREMPSS